MFHPDGPSLLELTQQALSETTRGYDLLARKFDYTPFRTPDELLEPMMEIIGPPKSLERALDVCCGTGAVMRQLRTRATENVTGIDLSQGMLDEAARRWDEQEEDGVEGVFLQQDVLEMSFKEEFDVITCCGAFGHILEHQQDAFAEAVHRALVPGGKFTFITHLMPTVGTVPWLAARGFNAVMHVRNALLKPPFIMFYLTFPLERASDLLGRHGFQLEVHSPFANKQYGRKMRVVTATRKR
jgi:ubiquinone/menaquinone biosynthesis C-methylase UbiE